jgi:hypothetical protein
MAAAVRIAPAVTRRPLKIPFMLISFQDLLFEDPFRKPHRGSGGARAKPAKPDVRALPARPLRRRTRMRQHTRISILYFKLLLILKSSELPASALKFAGSVV